MLFSKTFWPIHTPTPALSSQKKPPGVGKRPILKNQKENNNTVVYSDKSVEKSKKLYVVRGYISILKNLQNRRVKKYKSKEEWGLMVGNNFHEDKRKKVRRSAFGGVKHFSRISSFSELSQKRPSLERKRPVFTENNVPEAGRFESENYDTVTRQTVHNYLPPLIRIRATDKEGNSIEVTY